MYSNQFYLFKDKRFLPIFIVQFCGCLNDSIMKNALIILIAYKLANEINHSQVLVFLVNTVFILPFALFASISGQVADRYERSQIVKIIKIVEIFIVILAAYGFVYNNLYILFFCISLMGIHSTFFGPIKYSVLPDHLHNNELLGANGYVEAGTFISILIGTIIGGFYNAIPYTIVLICLIVSILGFLSSIFLPKSNNQNKKIKVKINIVKETILILKRTKSKRRVYLSILGISWFWFIAATILAQIPILTRDVLKADEGVANLFIGIFSLGVGIGSFLCNRLYKNQIINKYIVLASLGISICGIDLFLASKIHMVLSEPEQLKNIAMFLSKLHNWRIIIDLFFFSALGGMYVVPLFAIMQHFSSISYRSRIIAANNFMNAIFMALSAIILTILLNLGCSIPYIILIISLSNIIVAYYTYQLLPNNTALSVRLIKIIFKFFFKIFYRVEVKGIKNFYQLSDTKTIIIANHISYIDPALLFVYLPTNLIFAIDKNIAQLFWIKPFLKFARTLPIDRTDSSAIKTLINEVNKNKKIVIFPEGRISTTGSLMKVYEGPGMIADKTGAVILPIRIDGAQYTHFSKIRTFISKKIFQKIIITILPSVQFAAPITLDKKIRRQYIGERLYDTMSNMIFESTNFKTTIFENIINASSIFGYNKIILQDYNQSISYKKLLSNIFNYSSILEKKIKDKIVGIILENNIQIIIVSLAIQLSNKIPLILNIDDNLECLNKIPVDCTEIIITKNLKQSTQIITVLTKKNIKYLFLEDLTLTNSYLLKIKSILISYAPALTYDFFYKNTHLNNATAMIFIRNTQENMILLSYQQIISSVYQIITKISLTTDNVSFNPLPYYSTQSMLCTISMILSGIKTIMYNNPTHYKVIPEIIYDTNTSILFCTDILLYYYTKYAHKYDFYSVRYIFMLSDKKTSKNISAIYPYLNIFEWYFTNNNTSIISMNTPMHYKKNTIGKLLPKIKYMIKDYANNSEENTGILYVKGPNIITNCIQNINKNINKIKFKSDWFNTGYLVHIDDIGYITLLNHTDDNIIVDIENINLKEVEYEAYSIDPENYHIITYNKIINTIILYSTNKDLDIQPIFKVIEKKLEKTLIKTKLDFVEEIPVSNTGYINYNKLNK